MNIWLDDLRPMPAGYTHHARTAEEAIDLLRTGRVAGISLDHDLGLSSGYEVACWIEEGAYRGNLPRLEWRIHSANTVGAARIRSAMENADRFWEKTGRTD